MHQLWQNGQADECLRLVKALQHWCASSRIYPLVFLHQLVPVRWLQGSNTWHNVMVNWNFGPQHRSPTWTALPTWVLLNLWHIKSQGCQMSVWGIKLPHLVWPFSSAIWKGQDFQISSWFLSRWDLFMILMSRSHFPAWWPAELTCMSQAQQIGWAYWLLHVLCKRMKHYYPEPCLLVWFKHSCLFKLLLINMLLVRCCSNTNKASLRGKRLLGRCQW